MNKEQKTLPEKGLPRDEVMKMLRQYGENDPAYKKLKTWSLVYYLGEEHTEFMKDAYYEYFSANGLNPTVFQSLKRFETEVVRMTASLLNGDRNVVGVMTAGGTESCMLAVKTYRDMARDKKGIKKPEMVIPVTAHVAWEKGAHYFDVKPVRAPLDSDYRVDVKAVKKLINKNTVMILGGAPEYPHGLIDPIEELGAIAQEKNIPLHIDACVGGYILPFVEKLGYDLPAWDFRVPGVTSISADTHKYGFSAKGASTILYRNLDILKYQMFVFTDWPGGLFASPAFLGTRPGGSYSAAWASMMALGEDGYMKLTKATIDAARELMDAINEMPELEVIGKPHASLFAYRSVSRDVNIYAVGDQMQEKGWQIDRLQKPEGLHAMVTPLHLDVVRDYLSDLREAVDHVKKHPELASKGDAAMYGMIANIPMRGMVKKNVLKIFADMYGPEAKMASLSGSEMTEEGDAAPEKMDFATRIAMKFVKLKQRFSK